MTPGSSYHKHSTKGPLCGCRAGALSGLSATGEGEGTSLDTTTKTARWEDSAWRKEWHRARRKGRMYHRVRSGMKLGGNLKLITLTTSLVAARNGLSIQASFRSLMMRMRRRRLVSGYVKVIEYTRAGLPHIHAVIRGPYISQSWLSQAWGEIHRSPIVDVRGVRGLGGAASYLAKYMGKDDRARYSWSWDWVWKGFVGSWKALLVYGFRHDAPMVDIIRLWESILETYARNLARDGPDGIRV